MLWMTASGRKYKRIKRKRAGRCTANYVSQAIRLARFAQNVCHVPLLTLNGNVVGDVLNSSIYPLW